MSTAVVSTSLQRTYRYLRIGIAGTVVAIFVAVGMAAADVGWLTSVSDYFYTPARNVFVGALIAASLALVALSGRGTERALLDAAALFAPAHRARADDALHPARCRASSCRARIAASHPHTKRMPPTASASYLVVGGLTLLVAPRARRAGAGVDRGRVAVAADRGRRARRTG